MRRIVHLSDIHFGRVDYATVEPLAEAVRKVSPNVVVISGDLTQRAREWQFNEARRFLDGLPQPQVVIPGNHDIPLINVWARFLAPLHNYRKIIGDQIEPCHIDDEIAIVGVNTARSNTMKNGRINAEQVNRVMEILCPLPEHVTRIVVTHHPFDLPRSFEDAALVGRARMAVEKLAQCRIDVFLAGHYHMGHTGDTAARYAIPGYNALIVHAGTATSTRGRGQPNSFNIITVDSARLVVDRYLWQKEHSLFSVFSSEHFEETPDGWQRLPDHEPEVATKIRTESGGK